VCVCVCVSSLGYPSCNACPVLYCHLRPVRLYYIFQHYLIKGTIFGKKFIEHKMCVLTFSTTSVRNISHSKKNSARYYQKCTEVFTYSAGYSCQILIKPGFSRQILEKYSNIKFHENPSSGSQAVVRGRTDTTKVIAPLCNFSNACTVMQRPSFVGVRVRRVIWAPRASETKDRQNEYFK